MSPNAAPSYFRRGNSMVSPMVPTNLHIATKKQSSSFPMTNGNKLPSFPTVDFELVSFRSLSYTSLRDLLPFSPAIQSPIAVGTQSGYEIPIKNHLVKQAAWAYLQPMSTSPSSSNRHFLRRLWVRFSSEYLKSPVNACLEFINRRLIPKITRAFKRILGAIGVRMSSRR